MSKIIGYYASWSIYDRNYQPTDVCVEKLTHLNYAFADIKEGEIALSDPWADADKPYEPQPEIKGSINQFTNINGPIKRRNPNLKVLISVGGWTFSKSFSTVASTHDNRVRFCNSVLELLIRFNLDGVDIDWEFPVVGGHEHNIKSPEDGVNFSLLLQCLRETLNRSNEKYYLLSIATSAAPYNYQHLQFGEIAKCIDYVNIMTYDFTGPWSSYCHHQSNLFPDINNSSQLSCSNAVQDYINGGIPPSKIVMGVPFYARGFTGIEMDTTPPTSYTGYQSKFQCLPPGKAEAGVYQYHELYNEHLTHIYDTNTNNPIYFKFFNESTKASHLLDPVSKTFISYDGTLSLKWKCYYTKQANLGGIMIWELFGDCNGMLLNEIFNNLYN